MCVKKETLDQIFRHGEKKQAFEYEGKCCKCGQATVVSITKTLSGYGFLGGVLYEDEIQDFIIECAGCYMKKKNQ